jgi:Mn-containing catalase
MLALAKRTRSDREINPLTGADLGAGPGAGSTTDNVQQRE